MKEPLVSVIVPVYNTDKYLQRCIDSLLDQTYKNIEYIFVDDGSKDSSVSILKNAAEQDDRITVIEQPNQGPSAARNNGIKHSSGEYIMFCDSDDFVMPAWCEKLVHGIIMNPLSWVICEMQIFDSSLRPIDEYKWKEEASVVSKERYYDAFVWGLTGSPCNRIFNSRILKESGIVFNTERKHGEDVLFNLNYFDYCNDILIIKESLYGYVKYDERITLSSVSFSKNNFKQQEDLYNMRVNYITRDNMDLFQKHYWRVLFNEIEQINKTGDLVVWIKKFKQNRKNIKSSLFQELLMKFGKNEMHPRAFNCLVNNCYLNYLVIQYLSKIKRRIYEGGEKK